MAGRTGPVMKLMGPLSLGLVTVSATLNAGPGVYF